MNFEEKIATIKILNNLFIRSYPEGCIKITNKEGRKHRQVKADVCGWLKDNNWEFWTEANIKGSKDRPDILAISYHSGMGIIIEIVSSESEASLKSKENRYPSQFLFKKVYCKDFDYDKFCI